MAAPSQKKWLALLAAAAVLVGGSAALLLARRRLPTPPPPAVLATPSPPTCDAPAEVSLHPMPGAENPPVVLWAEGALRLSLDGARTFSAPESPKRLPVGEHLLEVEGASGRQSTRILVEAFRPAVFWAKEDDEAGLVLLRLNARCPSCPAADAPPSLDHRPGKDSTPWLLRSAADALRKDDWPTAQRHLAALPPAARASPSAVLLVAAFFGQTGQFGPARAAATAVAKANPSLAPSLEALARLTQTEQARREEVATARWNRLTDRFGALVRRFEPEARGRIDAHARRLEVLSKDFQEAAKANDVAGREALVASAEQTLQALVAELRGARPADCAFQTAVLATALE